MSIRENRFRLQQWQLAERQRYLNELESLASRLRGDAQRLREEIDATDPQDTLGDRKTVYQLFVRPLVERRDKLTRSILALDAQIAETRDSLTAAQQEMKVFGDGGALYDAARSLHHRRRQRQRA